MVGVLLRNWSRSLFVLDIAGLRNIRGYSNFAKAKRQQDPGRSPQRQPSHTYLQQKISTELRSSFLRNDSFQKASVHFSARMQSDKRSNEWENLMDNEDKKQNIASIPTRKGSIFTIPNLLSFGRIVAAPFIGNMILNGDYVLASSLLVIAGVTDVLDGQIARRWPSQQSAFGTALDPLGDKILVAVLTVTLTKAGMLPMPLAFLILGRDIALIASVFYLRYRTCPPPLTVKRFFDPTLVNTQLNPTTISKVNTVLQITVLWAALVAPIFHFTDSLALKMLYFVTGATTIWSGASYIFDKTTVQILKDNK